MRGVQVKLWDPLRTCAIPERLRGVFTTRRYINPHSPLPLMFKSGSPAWGPLKGPLALTIQMPLPPGCIDFGEWDQLNKSHVDVSCSGYCGQAVHKSEENLQSPRPEEHLHRGGLGWGVGDPCRDEVLSVQVDAIHWTQRSRMCSQGGSAWPSCLHRWTGLAPFYFLCLTSSWSLQTFCHQLKTHFFQLSYPHLIFDRLTGIVTVVLVVMFIILATLKILILVLKTLV